jgi:hypothetical protein
MLHRVLEDEADGNTHHQGRFLTQWYYHPVLNHPIRTIITSSHSLFETVPQLS